MLFRQITHDDLGCASYLIGDENAGVAAVVDPRLEIDEYLRLARYAGVHIEHILETHNHADHVSGHGRLAVATGATIHIHQEACPEYDHEPFDDGWELQLGSVTIRAIHTPGHRPEHTAFALVDVARGPEAWAVLTGDTLFVGNIARPDLAVDKEDGARGIFHSLHEQLLTLPDTCEVWPGHLGGSLCGGPGMDLKVSSTIGYERSHSELLRIADEDQFVRRSLAALGPQPPNFKNIVADRGPLRVESLDVHPLTPRQVRQACDDGALLVDVRTELQFDEAHVPLSVSITALRAGFGSELAWLVEREQPVVLIGRDDDAARHPPRCRGRRHHERRRLSRGRHDQLARGAPAGRADRAHHGRGATRAPRWRGRPSGPRRAERTEWNAGHIPGSVHAPYHDIHGLPDELDPECPVAVVCSSGQRLTPAASLLRRHGARDVIHVVDGGVPLWKRQGSPAGAAPAGSSLTAMVAAIPLGLALGLALGAVGGGGAVLAVPLLVYVLGEDVHAATTTSLAVVTAAALAAGVVQAGRARVCWPQVGLFAPAAVGGAVVGTFANEAVNGTAVLLRPRCPCSSWPPSLMWRRAGARRRRHRGRLPRARRPPHAYGWRADRRAHRLLRRRWRVPRSPYARARYALSAAPGDRHVTRDRCTGVTRRLGRPPLALGRARHRCHARDGGRMRGRSTARH